MVNTGVGNLNIEFFKGGLPILADKLSTVVGYNILWNSKFWEIISGLFFNAGFSIGSPERV